MTPQTLAVIGTFISFVAGVLASRGLISKETADYLASPDALAVVGTILGAAVAAYGLWRNRPHGIIQDAAALPQVDAVVTKPQTASKIPVSNVVGSITEASRVPGVTH
jgi:hypothetical protein